MFIGGWKPYLFIDFILVSHQFNPTPYFTTNKDRKSIQEKVWELHNEGWGLGILGLSEDSVHFFSFFTNKPNIPKVENIIRKTINRL